ncbi:low complexity protein [Moumouvirus goulette]|uniref:Low complexity protein n=1 Tax=Moumouvirus goulette TaxID=1247379 RepID=M1PXD8_9VIRU|nr:low complexity protein [Moumouvirus goulette]AGF85407.1 low complexity protein [Moumouvirus goulette]
MTNLYKVNNSTELKKVLETGTDKLVVLMFFTKNNSECKRALSYFEKIALNHTITVFCVVDTDKFEGDNSFVNNIKITPSFQAFYMGNNFNQCVTSNEREIETFVVSCEQQVMVQNNMRNNGYNQNNTNQSGMNNMFSQQNINPMFIKQQILNNAQMTNPMLYQQLMQNPNMLQQYVNQQMMQQPMQQPIQQPMQQPMHTMNNIPPISNTPQQNIYSIPTQIMPPQTNPLPVSSNLINQPNVPFTNNNSNNDDTLSSIQQMKKWFQIFQMMQSCGLLNTSAKIDQFVDQQISQSTQNNDQSNNGEIILENGDKIVPLGNGKYGLIKKS